MKVTVRAFTGMRPASAADLLRPGEAVTATNTSLSGGDLEPLKSPLQIAALTSAAPVKALYRFGQASSSETQFWFQSTTEADFVKGPVDGDTEERTYITGLANPTYPCKTKSDIATATPPYPTTVLPMGLAKPSSAPTVAVSGTATDPASTAESVVYVVTLVTPWGEEGPPSAASALVSWRAGQTINLTNLPTAYTASYPGNADKSQTYTKRRLYRSATGASGSALFLFVAELNDMVTTTYNDTATTASLGEALRSRYWVEPPDNMFGLTQMANGVLAGFSGNTVCFSETGVPYAWPVRYQQSVDAPIIGGAAFDQSLVVFTKRSIYIFSGPDPSSMTSERLAVPQTCVSKRSIVEINGGVAFACPDGLGFIGPGGFQLLTDGLMSRRDWAAYAPASMHAYETDNKYVAFYDTGTASGGIVLAFGSEPTMSTVDFYATAGFRDRSRDALYLVLNGGGTTRNVQKWDEGAAASFTWLSGPFRFSTPFNMACARVECTGTVNFELLADGVVKHGPVAVAPGQVFWLPSGYRSNRYQVRLTGTGTVTALELSNARGELIEG